MSTKKKKKKEKDNVLRARHLHGQETPQFPFIIHRPAVSNGKMRIFFRFIRVQSVCLSEIGLIAANCDFDNGAIIFRDIKPPTNRN